MSKFVKYKAYRKDAKEHGEVLLIDFENNFANVKFFTSDGKYCYEKSYDLDDAEIEFTQC